MDTNLIGGEQQQPVNGHGSLQECVNCGQLSPRRWCSHRCWVEEDCGGVDPRKERDEDSEEGA